MKHFCTFGSTPGYNAALARIKKQALDSGYFDTVHIYDQTNTPGIDAHREFIDTHTRGYGYWIWKPLIILDIMKKVASGDTIIYADAGCYINSTPGSREIFAKYLVALDAPPYRLGFYFPSLKESVWCKGDLLDYFGLRGGSHASSGQFMGGIQILKNTPDNQALMEEWLSVMTRDGYRFVDDSPSISPNEAGFREHRHDQSVISLLMKIRGTTYCSQPTHDSKSPIAIMRSRNR